MLHLKQRIIGISPLIHGIMKTEAEPVYIWAVVLSRYPLMEDGGFYMGKANNAIIHYLSDKSRFADLFNAVLYGGRQVLDPEKLREISPVTYEDIESRGDKKPPKRRERRKDLAMRYKDGAIYRIFLGEAQNDIYYALPLRNLEYQAAVYRKQYEKKKAEHEKAEDYESFAEKVSGLKKGEKLVPVHILWIYHGEDAWDGPRSFKDLLDFGNSEEEAERFSLEPKLICINEMEDFHLFRTELRDLMELLKLRDNRSEIKRVVEEDRWKKTITADTLEAASVLLNAPSIWKNRTKYGNRKEGYNLCRALREWREEIIEETTERVEKETAERVEKETTERISARVKKETTERNTIELLRNLIRNTGFSVENAMQALGVPEEVRAGYAEKLNEAEL